MALFLCSALFRPYHPDINIIDANLNTLPEKSSDPCPLVWLYLMLILQRFDRICNPDGDYSTDPSPVLYSFHPVSQ
ncbi:hypothetical protein K501DRAFT_190714 [Backusella circina FSU 941]|nr:hypothetical protein K501DRAFT_190714 [Backusella circina FSU 941]